MTFIKQVGTSISLAIVATLLSGCGDSKAPAGGEGGGEKPTAQGKRKFVGIGTATPGGTFTAVGEAISTVVDAGKGDLNWVISAEATKGTKENIRRLEAGDIQFGMANAAISYFAVKGEGWDKPYAIRAVATIAPNIGVFITPKNSGITTIAGLKGKRVVLGPSGAGFDFFLKPLLKAHGIAYEDLTEQNAPYSGAVDMLSDGKADAAFMGGAIPIGAVTQACSTMDIGFIPITTEAAATLEAQYPFYFTLPIPAGTYTDLDTDLTGINVGNMQLLTHANIDDDTVYQFTKIMYENRTKIAERHPAGKALNPKNVIKNVGTPFHPGAIKYYKEIGIWPEQ
ncbi:MAG: TRAP transporter TAXI family solute receptor [Kiritimatiellia bacterium]|jgi:uncharacterized protein